ncbi:MAG: MgtC/SapB family protein [Oscillospiraceae bacterium]|nr:MgtC/SapB family protein [Oscillospiraceae bacterium]
MQAIQQIFSIIWADTNVQMALRVAVRLALAALLGGVIGFERAHSHRAAGLRTHILVAVGAALVMCTSAFILTEYGSGDPARLGAQVISGIGFLGAGTILREGFSVKGLTTAASLWAVSCIGLAVGIGFWAGALMGTLVIVVTLTGLKRVNVRHHREHTIYLGVSDVDTISEQVVVTLRNCGAKLLSMQILFANDAAATSFSDETETVLKLYVYTHTDEELALVRESILSLSGVHDLSIDNA